MNIYFDFRAYSLLMLPLKLLSVPQAPVLMEMRIRIESHVIKLGLFCLQAQRPAATSSEGRLHTQPCPRARGREAHRPEDAALPWRRS